jgi:hypothetical protein
VNWWKGEGVWNWAGEECALHAGLASVEAAGFFFWTFAGFGVLGSMFYAVSINSQPMVQADRST